MGGPWCTTTGESELYKANPKYVNDPAFGRCSFQHEPYLGYGTKQGYIYRYYAVGTTGFPFINPPYRDYSLYADPSHAAGSTTNEALRKYRGRRSFWVKPNGVIYQWAAGWPAPKPLD